MLWHKKWCIIYIAFSLFVAVFLSNLIATHFEHSEEIAKLREDLNALTHKTFAAGSHCSMIEQSGKGTAENTRTVTFLVDSILRKKLSNIWDIINHIKRQLKSVQCGNQQSAPATKTTGGELVKSKRKRANYASIDLGARIAHVDARPVGGSSFLKYLLKLDYIANPPINILKSSMEPGNCFAYESKMATITIKLAMEVCVDAFELEHVAPELSPTGETKSAPCAFDVYALKTLHENDPILIGTFRYDNAPDELAQIYNLKEVFKVSALRFKFKSNHGNSKYTCIYRIAVYGKLKSKDAYNH